MSHYFAVVIVPGTTPVEQIEATVSRLLAPYDENHVMEPYRVSIEGEELKQMAAHYEISPHDLAALAGALPEWTGSEGGVDEQGRLSYRSTYNPQSKWDWWVIGGRWNGEIRNAPERDETGFNFGEAYHQLEKNMLPVKLLDHELTCFALVTPDGVWHEQGKMGWWAMVTDKKEEEEWKKEVVKLLQRHQDGILVGVDCHI